MGEFQHEELIDDVYRLFARPSFLEGIARLFDFSGTLNKYNYSKSGEEADFRAIESDWVITGNDLRRAAAIFERTSLAGVANESEI